MSYQQPEDVFYFEIRNRDHKVWKDTVTVKKENFCAFRIGGLQSVVLPHHHRCADHAPFHRLDSHQQKRGKL